MIKDWRYILAIVYAVICIFDFIAVPIWIGFFRASANYSVYFSEVVELDPLVQIEMLKAMTFQHEPFTLKGAGLFHLAFGALLTGSAIREKK